MIKIEADEFYKLQELVEAYKKDAKEIDILVDENLRLRKLLRKCLVCVWNTDGKESLYEEITKEIPDEET